MPTNEGACTQERPAGHPFDAKNAFEQPHKWGIGFAYCKDKKLTIGIDYTCQLWKGCRFPELQDNKLYKSTDAFSNRHKIAAGVEYMPDPESYKVSDHICYRAGFSYANSYTKVNGNNGPDDYTVSAGVGIPLVNVFSNRSVLNIAVQWEHLRQIRCRLVNNTATRMPIA